MKPETGLVRRVWLLTLAHTALDFYMTLSPPLYAVFKTNFHLSVFQTSFIPSFVAVCGSITQPAMGYFSDRRNRLALAGLGLLVTSLFVSSVGFAPSALALAGLLVAAAFGSSLFHPTAGGLVSGLVPHRASMMMAVFLTGGTLGMSLASVAGTQIVARWGLPSLWVCVFPGAILALFILSSARANPPLRQDASGPPLDVAALRSREMRPLWTLYAISVLRSLIHTAFVGFIALLGESRGWSTSKIGWVFSGYLLASMVGRFAGGHLADRVSARRLLAFSNATSGVAHLAFCVSPAFGEVPLFMLAGFLFDLGITTNIVLAQRLLPGNTSTATGLVMGFSWGTAGLLIPVVGRLAEATTISTALGVVSCFLFPAALWVGALPSSRRSPGVSQTPAGPPSSPDPSLPGRPAAAAVTPSEP